MPKGEIFVVSAPSGAGKTTLLRRVLGQVRGLHFSVSHTTRRPRPGETDGVDYHFIDSSRFDAMIAGDAFLEWAEIYGNRYGTSIGEVEGALARGEDVLLELDNQGAEAVRRKRPEASLVFILPPSAGTLRQRLESRGKLAPEELCTRIEGAGREVAALAIYDYCIVNDSLDEAVEDLLAILRARRLRRERVPDSVLEIVRGFDTAGAANDKERRTR